MMDIKDYLKDKGIKFKTFTHPPVYTCEEAEKYNKQIKGIHSKNLFLKDKKSRNFYLIIVPANKKLDIEELSIKLGQKLKFANNNDLKDILNSTAGSVSPFGLINDKEHKAQIIIDKEVWDSEFVSFHPNINTENLELTKKDFQKYLSFLQNKVSVI